MNWSFLNDEFYLKEEVKISPLDRGFLFGDAVYEVIPVYNQALFLVEEHLSRLDRSLKETGIPKPKNWNNLHKILEELIEKNSFLNQSVYLQISRGVEAQRSHVPSEKIQSTLFIFSSKMPLNPYRHNFLREGINVKVKEDFRWGRCDIKSVTLLANILALKEAKSEGYDEVIFYYKNMITEAATSNIFIVLNGKIFTPPSGEKILSGVTRNHVIKLLKNFDLEVLEKKIKLKELYLADEIWLTSSTQEIRPVFKIDKKILVPPRHPKEALWFQALTELVKDIEKKL